MIVGKRDATRDPMSQQNVGNADPIASRANLPADYGLPEDSPLLSWNEVSDQVRKALHYWLSTASADGVPIARPIDGMWVANALYFGGGQNVRWMRNLRTNPNACLTLEDAESVVILEGAVATIKPDAALAATLKSQAAEKYEWAASQNVEEYEAETCVFRPRKALAWTLLFRDATRFRFA